MTLETVEVAAPRENAEDHPIPGIKKGPRGAGLLSVETFTPQLECGLV